MSVYIDRDATCDRPGTTLQLERIDFRTAFLQQVSQTAESFSTAVVYIQHDIPVNTSVFGPLGALGPREASIDQKSSLFPRLLQHTENIRN